MQTAEEFLEEAYVQQCLAIRRIQDMLDKVYMELEESWPNLGNRYAAYLEQTRSEDAIEAIFERLHKRMDEAEETPDA